MQTHSVLHVVGRLDVGGVEKYLLDFVPEASRRGFRSHMATLFERNRGALASQFETLGCRIFPGHALRRRKTLEKDLRNAVETTGAAIVHSHLGGLSGDVARILHPSAKILAQAHDQGGVLPWLLIPYAVLSLRWTRRYSHAFAAVSDRAGRKLAGEGGTFARIPVGLDLRKWQPDPVARTVTRNSLRLDTDRFLLLHVARFHPVKNHSFLLRLMQRLIGADRKFFLAMAGDGPRFEEMKRLAARLGIEEYVAFLGRRDDVRLLVNAADVVLLPSLSEGTPRVLLEAAAMGIPFFATENADLSGLFPKDCQLPVTDTKPWERALMALRLGERRSVVPLVDLGINRAVEETLEVYAKLLRTGQP